MTITAYYYLYRFRLLAMQHGLDLILRQIQIQRFKSGYIRKMRDRIGLYTFQDAKVVTVRGIKICRYTLHPANQINLHFEAKFSQL